MTRLGHLRERTIKEKAAASIILALGSTLIGCGLIARQGVIAYLAVNAEFAPKQVEITMNKSFIEQYKNRVTMHTTFTVDKAMGSPLPPELDGDLHFAGRAPQVALPIVAEIVNGDEEKPAMALVHDAAGTGKTLQVAGVWRIWPEHAGGAKEDQGRPLPAFVSYKPDHVFELHPVTVINGVQLHGFTPVKGFKPGGAQRTFGIYEKIATKITVKRKTVSIVTETGLYNDVEFIMKIADAPQVVVVDGRFVIASAMDLSGNVLVDGLRMVFVAGTPPEQAVRLLKTGDRLHVYGMPRFDFNEIARRVAGSQLNPGLLTHPLPYEIVILGVYQN